MKNTTQDICTCNCSQRRRILIGALSAAFFLQSRTGHAQDDLLDPGALSKPNHTASQITIAPSKPDTRSRKPTAYTQSDARSMASSVVGILETLSSKLASHSHEMNTLDTRARELVQLMTKLQNIRGSKLEEYRAGMFCSGCGKTKSEILAAGQTFPHENQRVVRATPAEIAAKDRELSAPIANFERELQNNRTGRKKVSAELDEIKSQIDAGLALWQTSISFESSLLELAEQDSALTHSQAQKKIESMKQTSSLATTKDRQQALLSSGGRLERIDAVRRKEKNAITAAIVKAKRKAEAERDALNTYFGRGNISQVWSIIVTITHASPTATMDALGGTFRMGDYRLSTQSTALPVVERFISAFRSLPSTPKGVLPGSPAENAPANNTMRNILKNLLRCDPDEDKKCKPANNGGGGGIRG